MKRKDNGKSKGLIPVPRTSGESMGIISVEKEGIFGLKNNRWLKLFAVDSALSKEERFLMLSDANTRVRQTYLKISDKQYIFLSIMAYAESLDEARDIITQEARNIGRFTRLSSFDISKTMQFMQDVFIPLGLKQKDFNFAQAIRRNKKSWQELCSLQGEDKETYVKYGDYYGINYFVMDFCDSFDKNLYAYINSLNCPFLITIDFEPLKEDVLHSLNKVLEKRYNRRLADMGEIVFNLSHTYSLIFESKESAHIADMEIKRMASLAGLTLSPAFSCQNRVMLSAASFGITDFNVRRNVLFDTLTGFLL